MYAHRGAQLMNAWLPGATFCLRISALVPLLVLVQFLK